MSVEGKVAILTGTASGIGRETMKKFEESQKYGHIYSVDVNPDVKRHWSHRVEPVILDINNKSDVSGFVLDALKRDERVDVLVNAAGIMNLGRVETYVGPDGEPTPEYQQIWVTDYEAPLRLMNLVLEPMRRQRDGVVINVTSTKEYVRDPYHEPYADAKAALTKVSREMAVSEGPWGIRIVTLQPGNTKTNIDKGGWTPGSNEQEATEVQALNDWWRNTFGNDPKNVARVIYKIAEGQITDERVLTGMDAKLGAFMYEHVPYWENIFSLGFKSAMVLTRLSLAFRKEK